MNDLRDVFNKWATDAEFKKNFKIDPQKALEAAGLILNENDLKKILTTISTQEELEKKINK